MISYQKMEERYQASRDAMQTDEFMKPLIINEEGLVKGVGVCWAWSVPITVVNAFLSFRQ